jgi:hypothetical protein
MDINDIDDDNDGIPDVKENCFMPDPSIAATYSRNTGNYALVDGTFNNTKRGAVQITSAAVSGTTGVYGTPQNAIATGDCVSNGAADVGVRDVTFSTPVTNAIFLTDGFETINEYQDIEILAPFSGTPEFVILNNTFGATLQKISSTRYRVKSGATCNSYPSCPSSLTLQIRGAFYSRIRISGDDPVAASSCRFIKIGLDDASTNACNLDIDNDGIPNDLDLDSDGDGCSDALEGGATNDTTKNFKFAAPFGTNGLANSKETATDNGVINYTLNYDNAMSANIKACIDTDGDGVFDINDIDDDNDGIPDIQEGCSSGNIVQNGDFALNATGWNSFGFNNFNGKAVYTSDIDNVNDPDGQLSQIVSGITTIVNSNGHIPLSFNYKHNNNVAPPVSFRVYLNGVLLVRDEDYTASNGTSISALSPALSSGDVLEIITFTAFDLATAIPNTIFDAKGDLIVASGADTAGKLAAGTNGYYLKANSGAALGLEWAAVDALPSQSGNAGKYLTTDGSTASWAVVDTTAIEANYILVLMGAI